MNTLSKGSVITIRDKDHIVVSDTQKTITIVNNMFDWTNKKVVDGYIVSQINGESSFFISKKRAKQLGAGL